MKKLLFATCLFSGGLTFAQTASAAFILNFGNDSVTTGNAGTFWDGSTLNGITTTSIANPPGGAATQLVSAVIAGGAVVDTSGAPMAGVGVLIDTNPDRSPDDLRLGWNPAGNDGDGKFSATATNFGANVARSHFWGRHESDTPGDDGNIHDIQITGLANGTYTVGILSASSNGAASGVHDWYLQGTLAGAGISETAAQAAPIEYTVDVLDGTLTIGSDSASDAGNVVSLFQAVEVTMIPEPSSLSLVGLALLGCLRRRRPAIR